MSAARVVDGARASSCWVVCIGDQEKNFPSKAHAIAFCRATTRDTRVKPVIERHNRGSYTYWGPGREVNVVKARINRVSFAAVRARARKPLFENLDAARA